MQIETPIENIINSYLRLRDPDSPATQVVRMQSAIIERRMIVDLLFPNEFLLINTGFYFMNKMKN
jgi:hypothetical protein